MADATTTTNMGLPSFVQPYAEGYLNQAQQVANLPYQQYQGPLTADMNQYQTGAYQGIANRAMQGSPVMSAANGALPQFFGGQTQGATQNPYGNVQAQANPYAGSNPYLQQSIDNAQSDMVRNWNNVAAPSWASANQHSGSFGNAGLAMAENDARNTMQRNMGQIDSSMRSADYALQGQYGENAANRNLQAQTTNAGLGESYAGRNDSMFNSGQTRALSALGMAPTFANQDYTDLNNMASAGGALQAQQQKVNDANLGQFNQSRLYPQQQLDVMGNALSHSYGQQSSTTQPGASTASQVAGGALTGAALYNLLFSGG